MKKIKIAASTNPPQPTEFYKYLEDLDDLDVDYIHCDVMDGKFVENVSLSCRTVKDISKTVTKPLEVHLMVKEPSVFTIWRYLRLKPMFLVVHYEAYANKEKLKKILMLIARKGVKAGLSINPDTPVSEIEDIIPYCSHFLVMSVKPGLSGQKMMPESVAKIKDIKAVNKKLGIEDTTFTLDGGVNLTNVDKAIKAGYDIAVSGKALYLAEDKNDFIKAFTANQ